MPHKLPIHLSKSISHRYWAGQMFIRLIHWEMLAPGLAALSCSASTQEQHPTHCPACCISRLCWGSRRCDSTWAGCWAGPYGIALLTASLHGCQQTTSTLRASGACSIFLFSFSFFYTSPSLSPCSALFLQGPYPLICGLVLTGAPFSPAGPGGPCGPGRPGKPMGPAEPAGPRSPGEPCVGKEEGKYYWNIKCYQHTERNPAVECFKCTTQ